MSGPQGLRLIKGFHDEALRGEWAGYRSRVSVGESVRISRELQQMSQNEIAKKSGLPQSTISAIGNDRVAIGVERAKVIAKALKCHPAVLVFPGWELEKDSAA